MGRIEISNNINKKKLIELKKNSIMSCGDFYTTEQLNNWISYIENDLAPFLEKQIITYIKDNDIVGYSTYSIDNDLNQGKIEDLYVSADFQGQGIGTCLLIALEDEMQNCVKSIFVRSTLSANLFYRKHGYKLIEYSTSKAGFPIIILGKKV